ncbi:hypothetical protein BX616_005127, partial [Lobosporangium transversale]
IAWSFGCHLATHILGGFSDSDVRPYLWVTELGQAVRFQHRIRSFDFSPIVQQIAYGHGNGAMSVWSVQTGQLIRAIQGAAVMWI